MSRIQPEDLFRQGQGLFRGPVLVPEDYGKAGMEEAVIPLPGVDAHEAPAVVFHGRLRVRLLQDEAVEDQILF